MAVRASVDHLGMKIRDATCYPATSTRTSEPIEMERSQELWVKKKKVTA
jgi:hypothetical protein